MFQFSASIGDDYEGQWLSASTFLITITDAGTATPVIDDGQNTPTTVYPVVDPALPTIMNWDESEDALQNPADLVGDFGTYEVLWINHLNATSAEETLQYTSGTGWTSGAITLQDIDGGDLTLETKVSGTQDTRVFGLTTQGSGGSCTGPSDLDFAIEMRSDGNLYIYDNGVSLGNFGPYADCDILRIQVRRFDVVFKIYDGATEQLLYTLSNVISADTSYPLRGGGAFSGSGQLHAVKLIDEDTTYPPLIVDLVVYDHDDSDDVQSVDDRIDIVFDAPTNQPIGTGGTDKDCVDSLFSFLDPSDQPVAIGYDYAGSWITADTYQITLTDLNPATAETELTDPVAGKFDRFTTNVKPAWQTGQSLGTPGVTGEAVSAIQDETATSAATEAESGLMWGDFGGQDIDWYGVTNATTIGNDLYYSGGTQSTRGGMSLTQYSGSCWIEFLVEGTDHARAVGLNNATQNGLPYTWDYGVNNFRLSIFLGHTGTWDVRENGGTVYTGGAYSDGDIFRIAIESTLSGNDVTHQAKFYRNGVLAHTSTNAIATTEFPFHGKVGLAYGNNPRANDVRMSKQAPVIASVTARDPKNSDAIYHNDNDEYDPGDTLEVTLTSPAGFSAGTVWDKSELDSRLVIEETLGADYQGTWLSTTLLSIEVLDTTGHTLQTSPWWDRNFHLRHNRNAFVTFPTTHYPWRSTPIQRDFGGQDVIWEQIVGADLLGDSLYLGAGVPQGQGRARSQQALPRGDAWIEIFADGANHARNFGLDTSETTLASTQIDFSFGLGSNGTWGIYLNSHVATVSGTYEDGDSFRIQVLGDDIVFIHKDIEVHRVVDAMLSVDGQQYVHTVLGNGTDPHISLVRMSLNNEPVIVDFAVLDPEDNDDVYSVGDQVNIIFDLATSQPLGVGATAKERVDSLFAFTDLADSPLAIAHDYAGSWTSSTVYQVSILDLHADAAKTELDDPESHA